MARESRTIRKEEATNDLSAHTSLTRWLPLIWVAFAIVAALTCGIFIAAVPLRYARLLQSCAGTACQVSAAYTVGLDVVTALVWLAMAALVF